MTRFLRFKRPGSSTSDLQMPCKLVLIISQIHVAVSSSQGPDRPSSRASAPKSVVSGFGTSEWRLRRRDEPKALKNRLFGSATRKSSPGGAQGPRTGSPRTSRRS